MRQLKVQRSGPVRGGGQDMPNTLLTKCLLGQVTWFTVNRSRKQEAGFLKSGAGERVSSGELGTDGDSVGSQETRLPASNLASLKSVQQC